LKRLSTACVTIRRLLRSQTPTAQRTGRLIVEELERLVNHWKGWT
jgi:hypothetical protein